ncbi:hypothetical protein Tco_0408665 [Tanacetum coccineum]
MIITNSVVKVVQQQTRYMRNWCSQMVIEEKGLNRQSYYTGACLKRQDDMVWRGSSVASDEELEGPMKDQPLSADASPIALSPGYIVDFDPEEDKEDPEEDPADHPADGSVTPPNWVAAE